MIETSISICKSKILTIAQKRRSMQKKGGNGKTLDFNNK